MTPSLAALKELALKASKAQFIDDRELIEFAAYCETQSKLILSLIEKLEVAEARIKKLEDALEFYTQLPEMTVGNRVYKQLHLKALEALKEK